MQVSYPIKGCTVGNIIDHYEMVGALVELVSESSKCFLSSDISNCKNDPSFRKLKCGYVKICTNSCSMCVSELITLISSH